MNRRRIHQFRTGSQPEGQPREATLGPSIGIVPTSTDFPTTSASGTYRIYAHDSATATGPRGLRVPKNLDKNYGPGFTEKLQAVLVKMSGDDLKLLHAMDRDDGGLIKCENEDFETLRKLAVEIGLLR